MRFAHSRITRTLIPLVVSGCIGGTGSGLMGVAGGDNSSNTAPPVLAFFRQPTSTTVGQTLGTVQVTASDSVGKIDSTFTGTITLTLGSNSTGAALGGTTALRPTNGIASFTNLTIDRAGTYTLVASTPGAASVTSSAFTITPATTP